MVLKRKGGFANRAGKRAKTDSRINSVVDAITKSEAVPANLKSLLKATLPSVLGANKVDRHGYENEVVEQAQVTLKAVQAAVEEAHAAALAAQAEVIKPSERQSRTAAKTDAEKHLESMKAQLETAKADKKEADKATEEARDELKKAEADQKAAERLQKKAADKKSEMVSVLENEFQSLLNGAGAGSEGKKAVNKLVAVGKQQGLGSTLMQTFPIACKRAPDQRTEFETMMFDQLKGLIEKSIAELGAKLEEAEGVTAAKAGVVASAKSVLDGAEAKSAATDEEFKKQKDAVSEAAKGLKQADAHRRRIWEDMRAACEKQDSLKKQLDGLKEGVWVAFEALKEREPEPEPEAAEEAPEAAAEAPAEDAA